MTNMLRHAVAHAIGSLSHNRLSSTVTVPGPKRKFWFYTIPKRKMEMIEFRLTFRILIRLRVLFYSFICLFTFRQKKRQEKKAAKVALQEETKAKRLKKKEDLDSNGEDELSESGTISLYHRDTCVDVHFIWDTKELVPVSSWGDWFNR